MIEPALAHAIRHAPRLRDCGYAMPPAGRGRDPTATLLRDTLILMAADRMTDAGLSLRHSFREIAKELPMVGAGAVREGYYRARRRHPRFD